MIRTHSRPHQGAASTKIADVMSAADEDVSDSTLDKEFLSYLSLAEKCIRNKDAKKCRKWFKKLCGKLYVDRDAKRRRNAYLRRLLFAISKNKLTPPFDREPPTGSLTSLNEIFKRSASDERPQRYAEENEFEIEHELKVTEPIAAKPRLCKKSVYSTSSSKAPDSERQRYETFRKPLDSRNGVSGKLVITIDGKKTTHFNVDGGATCNRPRTKPARTKSWPSTDISSDENNGSAFDVQPGDHCDKYNKTRKNPSKSKERSFHRENVQKKSIVRQSTESLESFPLIVTPKTLKTEKLISAEPGHHSDELNKILRNPSKSNERSYHEDAQKQSIVRRSTDSLESFPLSYDPKILKKEKRVSAEPGDHSEELNKIRKNPSKSKEWGFHRGDVQVESVVRRSADSKESFPSSYDAKTLSMEKHNSVEPKAYFGMKKCQNEALKRVSVCCQEKSGILFEELSMAEVEPLFEPDPYSYFSTRSKSVNGKQKRMSQRTGSPLPEYLPQSEAHFTDGASYFHDKQRDLSESLKEDLPREFSNNSSELRSMPVDQLAAGFDDMTPYDETFQPCKVRSRPPFHSNRRSRASLSVVDRSRERKSRFTNRPRSSEKMSTVEEKTESSASSPRYEGSRLGTRGFEPEPRMEPNRRSRPETKFRSRQGTEVRSGPGMEQRSRQETEGELRSSHGADVRLEPETERRSRQGTEVKSKHNSEMRSRPETELRSRTRSKSEPKSGSESLSRSKSVISRIRDSLTPNRKREADDSSVEPRVDVDTISLATAYDEFCNKQPESAQKNICALYRIYPTAIVDKLLELWKVEGQAVIADYKEIHRQRIELMKKEFKEDIDRRSEAFQEEKDDLRRWRDCKAKLDRMMDDLTYLHGGGATKEQRQLMEALRIEISEERSRLNEERELNAELKKTIGRSSRGENNQCADTGNLKVELDEVSEKLMIELADICNDYQEQRMTLVDFLNE